MTVVQWGSSRHRFRGYSRAMPRPRRLVALALLAAPAITGCGESSAAKDVRTTVEGYAKAVAKRDYQALCDRDLAPDVVAGVEETGLPCEAALRPEISATKRPMLTVRSIKVDGDTARAQVHTTAANQSPADVTLALKRIRGVWHIVSTTEAGPQPAAP